jgi:hypothetical protein
VAYLLRLAGHQVLIMGSMNYIEREMEGLRPDLALVGANSQRREIYDYAGRLMRALGHPPRKSESAVGGLVIQKSRSGLRAVGWLGARGI